MGKKRQTHQGKQFYIIVKRVRASNLSEAFAAEKKAEIVSIQQERKETDDESSQSQMGFNTG